MVAAVSTHLAIDSAIEVLHQHKDAWVTLPLARKLEFLQGLIDRTVHSAERWVTAANKAKGIAGTPLEGEEWISGPRAFVANLQSLKRTLQAYADGSPRKPLKVWQRKNGQTVAQVFPNDLYDRLLFSGYRAEVWMQAGVTPENLHEHMGLIYREKNPVGKVALVLAAGNIASIAPLDMVYKLYAEGQVIIVKMNPVNDYLGVFMEEIFADFIDAGYVRFAYGGAEIGQYLVAHEGVEEIHITGSDKTHDAIVYGAGAEGAARKARREPLLNKRITSELGAVCPVIVVPGAWSDADIHYQAENIATMKMHNGGFNCVAAQVLILPENWARGADLVNAIREILKNAVKRPAYYPGADKRQQDAVNVHPQAEVLDSRDVPTTLIPKLDPSNRDDLCFRDEAFGGVLSVTYLAGDTPEAFLKNAVQFANETLWGTLGANVIIDPKTEKQIGTALEDAIADLRYGAVAINGWTGINYFVAECSWGAYPRHTYEDIQSGIGVVHNTLLFEKPEKSVSYSPFYPYPRTVLHGQLHLSPVPAWFITNRNAHVIGRRVTYFTAKPSPLRLPGLFLAALHGQFVGR